MNKMTIQVETIQNVSLTPQQQAKIVKQFIKDNFFRIEAAKDFRYNGVDVDENDNIIQYKIHPHKGERIDEKVIRPLTKWEKSAKLMLETLREAGL